MSVTRLPPRLAALAAAALLCGCDALPFGYTPLQDIVAAPARFEGREVKVEGRVAGVVKLPVVDFRAYRLRQGEAEISVVTQREPPAAGAETALVGTVRSAAIVGGQSLGLRIEESRRLR
jgi:hypothetical protein